MNEYIFLILIIIITALMLWQSYRINDFNVERIIFGVRVPEKYTRDNKVKSVIKEYNKVITIASLINIVLFLVIYYLIPKVYIIIIYSYMLAAIGIYAYYLANKRLRKVKGDIGWESESENKVYVQIGKAKNSEKFNFILFYIAGAIAILGLLITVVKMPSLPKMVPVHFGINGPNRWVDSTTFYGKLEVIMLPIVSIVCVGSMVYSAKLQAKKDNSKFNGGTISSLILKKSYLSVSMTNMLGAISLGVALMIFYGILLAVGVVEFNNTSNYLFMIVTAFVVIYPLTYWMSRTKKAQKLEAENDSKEKEIYRDDDKYYIWGIFYYNSSDPANIIRKRMGYGLDFNYAHIPGKLFFILESVLLIGIILSMITLNI